MRIYLNLNTAGRGGGGLRGSLTFLPNLIESELKNSQFTSSFDKLWITLSYPPMYVLPGVVGIEKKFYALYMTLPNSRLNRRYKKIDIDLKAPEFSEYFDLKDQENYLHRFEIETQYRNLKQTDLASILIDKYLEAGQIITSKIKKEDNFDFQQFSSVLIGLKEKITDDFLDATHGQQAINAELNVLNQAIEIREKRKKAVTIKDKRVRDLRIYHHSVYNKALYPYDYQYVEIFRNLLRASKLLCPTYHHLYIQAVPSFNEGLKRSRSLEAWYVNGISVFDFENFSNKSESEKERSVIELIYNGLIDIATIDNLDVSIIKSVTDEIRKKGLDTELVFNKIENSKHVLTITYLSRSMEEKCPIFLISLKRKLVA